MITLGDEMKFSIIVPIYKVEEYLEQCILSIVKQSYKNLEIILVDDGSPDNCPAICDEFAAKDARIKVVHKENEGLLNARKSGLEVATGDYIGFVDGDDYIAQNMYSKIASVIEKYNTDCVITQFYYAYPDRNENSDYSLNKDFYSRSDIEKEIFPIMLFKERFYSFGIYPCCWSKVFKRSIIEKYLLTSDGRIRLGEDIAFVFPSLMECNSIGFVDEKLYYYRQNPQSMTASYDSLLPEIYMLPYLTLCKKSEELGVDLSDQLPYYLLYLTNFVIRNEANKNNPKSKKEVTDILKSAIDNFDNEQLRKIELSKLPMHTRLLVTALKTKSVFALKIYMNLLKGHIK